MLNQEKLNNITTTAAVVLLTYTKALRTITMLCMGWRVLLEVETLLLISSKSMCKRAGLLIPPREFSGEKLYRLCKDVRKLRRNRPVRQLKTLFHEEKARGGCSKEC